MQELILDETQEEHKVDALELGRKFYTIDGSGLPVEAGRILLTSYDGNKAKSAMFHSLSEGGKEYALGNIGKSTPYRPVDHHRIVSPLVDSGFSDIQMVKNNRGGAGMFALLSHPEIHVKHIINWDTEIFGEGTKELNLAIAAWADARTGKSIRIVAGFFRSICSNGLISQYLNLGAMRVTSSQFSADGARDIASKAIAGVEDFKLQTFSPKVVEWPLKIIDQYEDDPHYIDSLPKFARQPFSTAVAGMPRWYVDEVGYQLSLISESSDDITVLDVLNMVTNVANANENSSQVHFNLETIVGSFIQLMAISAFKMDLDFPIKSV